METYHFSWKKNTADENSRNRKVKIDECFYQIVLFVARKNQLLLKIKNSTISIIFEMISLK